MNKIKNNENNIIENNNNINIKDMKPIKINTKTILKKTKYVYKRFNDLKTSTENNFVLNKLNEQELGKQINNIEMKKKGNINTINNINKYNNNNTQIKLIEENEEIINTKK